MMRGVEERRVSWDNVSDEGSGGVEERRVNKVSDEVSGGEESEAAMTRNR